MGQAPVGTGDHNGVKGLVRRAEVEQEVLDPRRDLPLRHPGAQFREDLVQGLLRDALGGGQGFDLLRVLHLPQFFEEIRRLHQFTGELFAVLLMGRYRHIRVLKAHAVKALLFQNLLNQRGVPLAGFRLPEGKGIPQLFPCRLRIAAVGEIPGGALRDERHAVRAGGVKAGGVKAVGLLRQEHGVQFPLPQLGADLGNMVHDRKPSLLFSHSMVG